MTATTTKLPPTDTGKCGTYPGYSIHRRRGEDMCPPCRTAQRAYDAERRKAKPKPPKPPKPAPADPAPTGAEILITEIEFLLMCGEGEHGITRALGYDKPKTLQRRLHRNNRPDLIQRVFAHQAELTEAKIHSGSYNGITRTR